MKIKNLISVAAFGSAKVVSAILVALKIRGNFIRLKGE